MTGGGASAPLAPREGYALWAPDYARETAVSFLEDALVRELGVDVAGKRLLDVGCGTGRRLQAACAAPHDRAEHRPALAMGIDLTPEMLARAPGAGGVGRLAAGDARRLPVAAAAFDVVWCRLVIGHIRELAAVYAELGRVCTPAGTVVVTDFHPDAVAAGHRRTFRDARGTVREIEHHVHTVEEHQRAAAAAGLVLASRRDGSVGEPVRSFYAARPEIYAAQRGLHLVLGIAFRKL